MRMTILRMISTGSLSAFSASIAQTRPGQVQGVRALGTAAAGSGTATAAGRPVFAPVQGASPFLPRGSLLDLSV